MRIRVFHSTICRYDPPASGAIQVLRLTPRNFGGQHVVRWRIDVTPDARLAPHEDAFGNVTHVFTTDGPLSELRIEVDGVVEIQNSEGVVRGTVERFPPSLFLRDTALTAPDATICQFAEAVRAESEGEVLTVLHALLQRLHAQMTYDPDAHQHAADAAETFARKGGGAADLTHLFIGAAHCLGIPARFIAGYYGKSDRVAQLSHAWAEAYVPGLGWVGFDAALGFSPTDAHLRVAVGLDALGAAPVRGTRHGVGGEALEVAIAIGQ